MKRTWTPYLLIAPTLIYLAFFFAWPMFQALKLAVWDDTSLLQLRTEASLESSAGGSLAQNSQVEILEEQAVATDEVPTSGEALEQWFLVRAGEVEGWVSESRIRVRGDPTTGTVRRRLGSNAEPQTDLYESANSSSPVVAQLEPSTGVDIVERQWLELWYRVSGERQGRTVEGWAPARNLQIYENGTTGRVSRGNAGELTPRFLTRMVNDRFFWPALTMTLLVTVLIIPVQFALAIAMALIVQSRLKGSGWFLYIFAIPLGVSELAVGILFFAIFTQSGLLNSFLQGVGLIDSPSAFLTSTSRHWIVIAIWLAEIWRSTSLVMVIVVSGLQAISDEVLEAAEVFGAGLWKRIRYVILPLLKPSLQVALILRTILALQVFAVVVALSGGDIVTVLANEAFRQYSELRNANMAAAYAALILLISMVSAIFYLRAVRTSEEVQA
jgi:multiple sugar transport system permease protein